MNDHQGYTHIPQIFFLFITFLTKALPVRSIPTFIELLIGAMLTQAGFVTRAWLAVNMRRQWTSYYKWLQKGKWSWVKLGIQMAKLFIVFFLNQKGARFKDQPRTWLQNKPAEICSRTELGFTRFCCKSRFIIRCDSAFIQNDAGGWQH